MSEEKTVEARMNAIDELTKSKPRDFLAHVRQGDFKAGLEVDVTNFMEKKGQFTYLSWVWALVELQKMYPLATWGWDDFKVETKDSYQIHNYLETPAGFFVRSWVQLYPDFPVFRFDHPVLDHQNKTVMKPNAFDINTSRMRGLTKLVQMVTGIGLHIYAGEDLPDKMAGGIPASTDEIDRVKKLLSEEACLSLVPNSTKTVREYYTAKLEKANWGRKDVQAALKHLTTFVQNWKPAPEKVGS